MVCARRRRPECTSLPHAPEGPVRCAHRHDVHSTQCTQHWRKHTIMPAVWLPPPHHGHELVQIVAVQHRLHVAAQTRVRGVLEVGANLRLRLGGSLCSGSGGRKEGG